MLKRALGEHTREEELTDEDSLSHHSDSVMDYGRRTAQRGNDPYASIEMETNIKETATLNYSYLLSFVLLVNFIFFSISIASSFHWSKPELQ